VHEDGATCWIAALENLKDPAIGRVYLMIGQVTILSGSRRRVALASPRHAP
jgi:hypothetical protein